MKSAARNRQKTEKYQTSCARVCPCLSQEFAKNQKIRPAKLGRTDGVLGQTRTNSKRFQITQTLIFII